MDLVELGGKARERGELKRENGGPSLLQKKRKGDVNVQRRREEKNLSGNNFARAAAQEKFTGTIIDLKGEKGVQRKRKDSRRTGRSRKGKLFFRRERRGISMQPPKTGIFPSEERRGTQEKRTESPKNKRLLEKQRGTGMKERRQGKLLDQAREKKRDGGREIL